MFFSHRSRGRLIMTLEVQSSVARCSLFRLEQGALPEIISSAERAIPYRPGIATGRFVQETMKALSESVDAVLTQFSTIRRERKAERFPRHIDEAHYILSSPWIACQARALSLDLGRPTRITMDKVKELLEAERAKIAPTADGPTQIIEEKIFEVRLNGYSVAAWQNKEVRDLEITYALGVTGTGALERFVQACERAVPKRKAHFHSSLLLQYVGLRSSMPEKDSYTLIHVHGELSDVVIVDRGACIFFGSYPTGIRSIVRSVAHTMKTDDEAADSFLNMYAEKHIEEESAAKAATAMEKIAGDWIRQFRGLLAEVAETIPSPSNAIIVARAHQEFFAGALRKAYPEAKVEIKQIDDALYARAIHSLEAGRSTKDAQDAR